MVGVARMLSWAAVQVGPVRQVLLPLLGWYWLRVVLQAVQAVAVVVVLGVRTR